MSGNTSAANKVEQRDPDEMTLEEIRDEFLEVRDSVDLMESYEGQEDAWDRREKLWRALEERSHVEQPECSNCGEQRWSQSPGDPVSCRSCGTTADADTEEAVHNAWNRILRVFRHEQQADMAEALLNVDVGDKVKTIFVMDAGEKTTKQRVVDVSSAGTVTTIHCEKAKGWSAPSINFEVITTTPVPELRNHLQNPMGEDVDVREFKSMEIERGDI